MYKLKDCKCLIVTLKFHEVNETNSSVLRVNLNFMLNKADYGFKGCFLVNPRVSVTSHR